MKTKRVFGQDTLSADDVEHSLGLPGTFALWLGANVVVTTILTGMFLVPQSACAQALLQCLYRLRHLGLWAACGTRGTASPA